MTVSRWPLAVGVVCSLAVGAAGRRCWAAVEHPPEVSPAIGAGLGFSNQSGSFQGDTTHASISSLTFLAYLDVGVVVRDKLVAAIRASNSATLARALFTMALGVRATASPWDGRGWCFGLGADALWEHWEGNGIAPVGSVDHSSDTYRGWRTFAVAGWTSPRALHFTRSESDPPDERRAGLRWSFSVQLGFARLSTKPDESSLLDLALSTGLVWF